MTQYNIEKIVKIRVYDAHKVEYKPVYKKEIKIMGLVLRKEGIYSFFGSFTPMSEFKKEYPYHFIKDGELYNKPELRMWFQGDQVLGIYRDTKEECIKKANEVMDSIGKWMDVLS